MSNVSGTARNPVLIKPVYDVGYYGHDVSVPLSTLSGSSQTVVPSTSTFVQVLEDSKVPVDELPIFISESDPYTLESLIKAVLIGIRFDLRLAIMVNIPQMIFCALPIVNVIYSIWVRRISNLYIYLFTVFLLLFYAVDIGHYSYLGRRVDVSVLRFLDNPEISAQMVWESYPVIIILIFLLFIFIGFKLFYNMVPTVLLAEPQVKTRKQKFLGFTIGGLIILLSVSGESQNLVNAAKYCKKKKINCISVSGFKRNNSLSRYTKISLWINSKSYNLVEIIQMIILLSFVDKKIGSLTYKSNL